MNLEKCLLTPDEEYKARLMWKKSPRDISWRDYWLKTQLTKAIPIIAEEMKTEAGIKECIDSIIKRERQAQAEEIKRGLERMLDIRENDMSFCEISNHIPYSTWQSYWGGIG